MTNHQSTPSGNYGSQPGGKTDWLDQLKAGVADVEHYLRMEHHVNVKTESEKFKRDDKQAIDYRPFVSSITYGVNSGDTVTYGDPKPFMVTIERSNGDADDGWEAIGLTSYVAKDGSTREGYLVTKPQLDDQGNVVGQYSRVNDIIQTEELTRLSKIERQQKLAGSSAANMALAPQPVESKPLITTADVQAVISGSGDHRRATPEQHIESAEDRESRILADFSDDDRRALSDFAYYAKMKRDAQVNNEGESSRYYSGQMGQAMKDMTPQARSRANGIATNIYGPGKVAF